jgi:hypothetical protein
MLAIIISLGVMCLALIWYFSLRSREYALGVSKNLCEKQGVQLLDDSVAIKKIRCQRIDGQWALVRVYQFEYTTDGRHDRKKGFITFLGRELTDFSLPIVPNVIRFPQAKNDPE